MGVVDRPRHAGGRRRRGASDGRGTLGLIAWGGPLLILPVAAATAVPVLARRHLARRGRRVTAVVLVGCTVLFALASVVIVWLTILDVNCPPEASDCL